MGSSTTALFLCLLVMMAAGGARGLFYNWEVKQEMMGSYKEQVVTINGQHRGPTIQAHQGDRVFVRVTNRLSQNVAIHWHNTQQIQSLGSDGTGDVVPRTISPGKTFTYVFIVHQLGKSPYNSYYTMQTVAGLHGLIDVLPPYGVAEPFAQDYNKSIILDDRYYRSYYDWVAEPESLLIPRTDRNAINPEYLHWRVVLGQTYYLNISSVTPHCNLSFQIEGHNLTVVEVDGHYVEPFVNQSLIVYSGKTYSVKIKANQDPSRNYSITTDIVGQNTTATTPLGLAVLSYSPPAGPIRNGVSPQSVQSLGNKACEEHQMMLAILPMLMWLI
ncbi:L-ascorbate oxidase [Eucalyptus grandis]|uniref:L-ascorbate oxidase n=1 Tax=Eucalyptus grandis TaxID=71139 RepID=UPI00192EC2C3|nr:L-ascorbate oxidase [Eucalyptus grandis]